MDNLNLRDDTEFEARFFDGPVWDDAEELEAEGTGAATGLEQNDLEDDVEGHASGFS